MSRTVTCRLLYSTTTYGYYNGSAYYPTLRFDLSGIALNNIFVEKASIDFRSFQDPQHKDSYLYLRAYASVEQITQNMNGNVTPGLHYYDSECIGIISPEQKETLEYGMHSLPLAGSQEKLLKALTNGVYFDAKAQDGHRALIDIDYVPARLTLTYTQDKITPKPSSPTGTISKGGIFRFKWSTDLDAVSGSIAETYFEYQPLDGSQSTRVSLGASAAYYDFDTSKVAGTTGMIWRVGIASRSGTTTWSEWVENYFSQPNITLGELYPTGRCYHGFPQIFRWSFEVAPPAGALGSNIYQTGAELQYRPAGGSSAISAQVTGAITTLELPGDALPIGSFEWRVVAATNIGYPVTTGWQTNENIELAIKVGDLYPDASGHAVRGVSNRFGWTFSAAAEEAPGDITQTSAKICWREYGTDAYNEIVVRGASQYCDIPAGTFRSEKIEWYVTATANTGTTAISEIITVSTLDTLSTPTAISPAGQFLDDTLTGIIFSWQHANATGTPQTGWELSYSQDEGASYAVLQAQDDDAPTWQAAVKTFSVGNIYWRVRTKNMDGLFGGYSAPAIFAIRRAPDAPAIVYSDTKPMPTIKWQSDTQTGYEIEMDGESQGMAYGSQKSWQSRSVMDNGPHTIRVRVINEFRDISPWSTVTVRVENHSRGAVFLTAVRQWAQVSFLWTLEGDFSALYLLRDGQIIAKPEISTKRIADRSSVGLHSYVLRAFDADGYYTDSGIVQEAPSVPYAAIGLLDGSGWCLLKWSSTWDRYSRSATAKGSYLQFWGHRAPTWEAAGHESVTHSISYCRKDGESLKDLDELRGRTVVYKDAAGNLAVGVFETLPEKQQGRRRTFDLVITETDREVLDYDQI